MNNTGGPAFPTDNYAAMVPLSTGYSEGMSLRDFFAAKAMQGWVACSPVIAGKPMNGSVQMAEQLAGASYILADAMLKARELK